MEQTIYSNSSQSEASVFKLMGDIISDPANAFASIRERPKLCIAPLILSLGLLIGFFSYYFGTVEPTWFIEHTLAQSPDLNNEQKMAMREYIHPNVLSTTTILSATIISLVVYAMYALFVHLVSKVIGQNEFAFTDWFSLTVWASFPSIFATLAMFISYLADGSGQVSLEEVNIISFNQLFFNLPSAHAWTNLLNSLTLTTVWTLALSSLGFKIWTRSTWTKSIILMTLPYILIYGIWAFTLI